MGTISRRAPSLPPHPGLTYVSVETTSLNDVTREARKGGFFLKGRLFKIFGQGIDDRYAETNVYRRYATEKLQCCYVHTAQETRTKPTLLAKRKQNSKVQWHTNLPKKRPLGSVFVLGQQRE